MFNHQHLSQGHCAQKCLWETFSKNRKSVEWNLPQTKLASSQNLLGKMPASRKKRTIKSHTGLNSLDCISIIYKFVLWTHATVTWQNKVIVIIRLCPTGKYLDYNTSNYAFNKTKVPESQTNTSCNSHSLSFKVINPTLMHRQCAVFLCTDGEEQKQ